MKSIWKFSLGPDEIVMMPEGAEILCVQTQRNEIFLWALVEPKRPLIERKFQVIGTGWELTEDSGKYLGTVQLDDGFLVFHVFEKRNTV